HVPVPGEEPRTLPDGPADAAAEPSDSADGAPIDLNTADAAELEELPGVGPAIAQRILEHREKNGPFTSVDGLLEVSGIGPATLEEIRGRPRYDARGPAPAAGGDLRLGARRARHHRGHGGRRRRRCGADRPRPDSGRPRGCIDHGPEHPRAPGH